ncbi:hypothetical protein BDV96DRAFT_631067 [Lophiotrema nucula]|uniref:Uncharacterized protein n=1 Tax=Lophiotrema nucula TaxID=690887 RepID=A0A6A5ZCV9_9PLEO|nr:hypothetical protein BDV96DRAFT_631067 [Lophiotrema nucula]
MDTVQCAASRVLALPELLEIIFLYAVLPGSKPKPARLERKYVEQENKKERLAVASSRSPRELAAANDLEKCKKRAEGMCFILCSAKRVNRTWNAVIGSSKAIQEALFFRWHGHGDCTPTFNPLLVSKFKWGYFHKGGDFPDRTVSFCGPLTYEKASWRDMYPMLPPFRQVKIFKFQTGGYYDEHQTGEMSSVKLQKSGATTMGMLFDICEEWKEPDPKTEFRVRWELDWGTYGFKNDRERRAAAYTNPFVTEFASEQHVVMGAPLDHVQESSQRSAPVVSLASISLNHYDRFGTNHVTGFHDGIGYPKLKSDGKKWSLDDFEWGPVMLDK